MTLFPISVPHFCVDLALRGFPGSSLYSTQLLTGKVGPRKPFLGIHPASQGTDPALRGEEVWGKRGKTENVATKGSSASKTEARFNKHVSGEHFFSFSEKLIQKFLPVEKRDDTLFRAPGETIACEHLNEATA